MDKNIKAMCVCIDIYVCVWVRECVYVWITEPLYYIVEINTTL